MALKEFIQSCLDQNHKSLLRYVEGLTPAELSWCPDPQCMSIGFLLWHSARAQDFLIQSLAKGTAQIWEEGWAERFNRAPANPRDVGFGFTVEQVQAFQVPAMSVLLGYVDATQAHALEHLREVEDEALVGTKVNSPMGGQLSLASVYQQFIWEMNQHGGQIAYLRGMQRGIEDSTFAGGVFEAAKAAA